MFAVIKTGGKQYKVTSGDVIRVEKLDAAPGADVDFAEVLMLNDGATTTIGAPLVAGACVAGTVVEQTRGPKIIVFKKKRRQNYRRRRGHRQDLTVVRITEILPAGAARQSRPATEPAAAPAEKSKAKPAAEKAVKTAAKKEAAKERVPKTAKKAPARGAGRPAKPRGGRKEK